MAVCSFCAQAIEKGTGKMFVKKDGTVFNFCSNKCEKNQFKLGRLPQHVKWTNTYHKIKEITRKGK